MTSQQLLYLLEATRLQALGWTVRETDAGWEAICVVCEWWWSEPGIHALSVMCEDHDKDYHRPQLSDLLLMDR